MRAEGQPSESEPERHHIGPALRALRELRGLRIRELAERAGVSVGQISRIERGRSQPSFFTLLRLAEALEVDLTYFTSYQRTSLQLERDLLDLLQTLELPVSIWSEFARLGIEARGALIDALRRLLPEQPAPPGLNPDLFQSLEHGDIAALAPRLLTEMDAHGLSPVQVAHAMTQIEELPGNRVQILQRLMLASAPFEANVDLRELFRALFGVTPPPRLQPRWWTASLRSSLLATLNTFESRVIYQRAVIEAYARTGRWGPTLQLRPADVRRHLQQTIDLIRSRPRYQIGIVEAPPPFNLLIKGDDQALVYSRWDGERALTLQSGVGLRFSQPSIVRCFQSYANDLWDEIPPRWREAEAIATWLEGLLPEEHSGPAAS